MTIRSACLVLLSCLCLPALSQARLAPAAATAPVANVKEAANNASHVRYRADYVVEADATNIETDYNDILVKTKSGVDAYRQARLNYSS